MRAVITRAAVLLRLSARSVGRNMRRSMLTAAAMVLGLALLMFSRALAEGGHEQWIDDAVRLGSGHVAIQAPGYLETGKLENRLDASGAERAIQAIEGLDELGLQTWAPRLTIDGLASSAASALPVRIVGVDPQREAVFSDIHQKLQGGRYLETGDRLHAYIGTQLAQRLDLDVGDRFVLTAQTTTGEVEGQLVRVAGIFRTSIPEMDEGLIHIPIETARSWLHAPGAVTTLAALLESGRQTDAAVARLKADLADEPGLRVLGWREASPDLDSALRIDDYGDYVFHSILFAIVALAILNAILISVLGRRREFGILQAMGLTGFETALVVFGEGLFLTTVSGVAGMVLGFLFTWGFFRDGIDFSGLMDSEMTFAGSVVEPVIVPVFHSSQVLVSVYFILVIGTLASLYPAIRAARLDPAEAMKFDQ
jgi:putative ABC transport system permease protein